jgi:hypothetical protein
MGVDLSEENLLANSELPEQSNNLKQLNTPDIVDIDEEETSVPSIKDVIMKQLPSSETEWIMVYAYYASNHGTNTFTSKDILIMYENTKRKTASRHANMSKNIRAIFSKGYFSALNDDDFILTDDGKHNAQEIVSRTHSTPLKQSKPKVKKEAKEIPKSATTKGKSNSKKKSSNTFEVLKTLNLRPSDNTSLIDYMDNYEVGSNADRIIVVINYLKEILKIENVTGNHIYTAFWVLKCKIPTSFNQVLINTRGRSKYIDYETTDDINLSIPGANRLRLDIIK